MILCQRRPDARRALIRSTDGGRSGHGTAAASPLQWQEAGRYLRQAQYPGDIDVIAQAGFDFVVVDLEHSQLDDATARLLVRHAAAISFPAVVRLPVLDPGAVNRLLEAGAVGVQLSTVRSAAAARDLRNACRYPPEGRRSVSLAHQSARYGATPLTTYLTELAANPPLVVGQIESACVDSPLEDIVRALDVVFVGTTDLAVDLGAAGRPDDPVVTQRIADIAAATSAGGAVLGAFAASVSGAADLWALGVRYLVVASDLQILGTAIAAALDALGPRGAG